MNEPDRIFAGLVLVLLGCGAIELVRRRVARGGVCPQPVGLVDLPPTFFAMAGVPLPFFFVVAGALLIGITAAFALQSLVHMVVCLDLLPPKGIPLPLVSYGKTEMLVTLVSVGLLLNLSREVKA